MSVLLLFMAYKIIGKVEGLDKNISIYLRIDIFIFGLELVIYNIWLL